MADPPQLPTADEFFGGPKPLPTAEEFFRPPHLPPPPPDSPQYAGAIDDDWVQQSNVGPILDAFGQGAKDGWGTRPLGLDEDTVKTLRQYGVFNDYEAGRTSLVRTFNETLIRGGAAAIDATMRGVGAVIRGISEAGVQAGVPPDLTPEAAVEAFPVGHLTGAPARVALEPSIGTALLNRVVPPIVDKAADLGVIGKGDAGWRGLPPPPETPVAEAPAAGATHEAFGPPAPPVAEAAPVRDVHAAAREIAPEVFREYDPLTAQRDTLRGMLDDLTEQRAEGTSPEIAAVDREIEQLRTARLEAPPAERADLADQVTALETRRASLVDELEKPGDTPAIARVRGDLQTIDYRMRDLAPQVSDAYRRAAEGEPPTAAAPPAEAAPAVPATPAVEPAPAAPAPPVTAAAAEPRAPLPGGGIAGNVEFKAIAAGYPADEARAIGAVWQAYYETRAARFGGARGTAEDLYREDAPDIVASRVGRGAAPETRLADTELAQTRRGKIRLASDQFPRAVITLFRSADASTLIHESGHAWLEDLMTDAAHPLAPDELRADATTVRKWLGVKEGEPIPRAGHEKFARGFERYLMEGHAPSAELAGVFARFRDWLIRIYQTVDRLRAPINDDIRGVFDRMLAQRDEGSVVAPEREPAETFADLHEADAASMPPHQAGNAADMARAERDTVMSADHPEINDERLAAISPTEAGGGGAGGELPGRGGAAGGADTAAAGGVQERGAVGAGRGGAAPQGTRTPPPAEPNAPLGPADTRLIDKAGNIRLDNLNAPSDVEEAIRDAAERNADFTGERRGVVSDGQLLDLADALGKDPSFLDEKKIGQAFNAEEVLAARKLLVASATAVRDAMAAAATGGDAEIVALAKLIARHEMVQGKVAQATAEWGRAGRAFRSLEGWEGARDLNQLLKENTGRDLSQLREMAQLGSKLDTPAQVSKLIADSAGGKLRQAVIYYWVNTLISGPITHLTYSVGNAVNALWTPLVETPLAATSGAVRAALGVEDADRVFFNEATAQLYGLGKGFRDGIGAAVDAFKSGVSPPLPGERIPAEFLTPREVPIPGVVGTAIGLPGRSVSAIHSFFKTIRYEQNIAALAVRDALGQGLEGAARDLRVAQLTASPTEAMMESAVEDALKELYMRRQPYNSPGAYLARTTNSWLPAKILSPFVKIGSEIVRNAFVERTPLGVGSAEVRANLAMREGGAEFDKQIGKIMAGTGLMAATVLGVLEGNITGDGPSDPNERRTWLLSQKPNSISVGPLSFSYARLGHLAMLTRFAANMTETGQRWDDEDGAKLAHSFFDAITRSVLDETWMRGVKDMFDAIYHPDEHFDSWVTQFVAQWTPYSIGLGQVARSIDPYQRETRDLSTASEILNQIKAHTPLWSQTLPPKRDMFGEPITTGSGTVDRYANDPVVKRMDELHIGLAPVERKIRGVPLTPQQYDDYARISGRMAKMELDAIVGSGPAFGMMPPETQIKSIKEIVSQARESAATLIMMQSYGGANDILKAAVASKDAALHGASPLEVREKLKAR